MEGDVGMKGMKEGKRRGELWKMKEIFSTPLVCVHYGT